MTHEQSGLIETKFVMIFKQMKLLVSHVETPIVAWGQKISVENANELASLQEQMAILCPDLPKISGKPESDKVILKNILFFFYLLYSFVKFYYIIED